MWPNAAAEAAQHKAHIVIMGLKDPVDREAALAKARAVTLLAAAIARVVPAIGVDWADGANLVKAAAFATMTEKIAQPDGNAVMFWVRLMFANGPPAASGEQTMKACASSACGSLSMRLLL
jgi:hypothetical protein